MAARIQQNTQDAADNRAENAQPPAPDGQRPVGQVQRMGQKPTGREAALDHLFGREEDEPQPRPDDAGDQRPGQAAPDMIRVAAILFGHPGGQAGSQQQPAYDQHPVVAEIEGAKVDAEGVNGHNAQAPLSFSATCARRANCATDHNR